MSVISEPRSSSAGELPASKAKSAGMATGIMHTRQRRDLGGPGRAKALFCSPSAGSRAPGRSALIGRPVVFVVPVPCRSHWLARRDTTYSIRFVECLAGAGSAWGASAWRHVAPRQSPRWLVRCYPTVILRGDIDEAAIRRRPHHIVLSQCRYTQACSLRRRSKGHHRFAHHNKKRRGAHRWSGGVRGKQLCSAMELGRDDWVEPARTWGSGGLVWNGGERRRRGG